MTLVTAVFIGLAAGLIRARVNKTTYRANELRYPGLVILAFIPQFIAFSLPATRSSLPDNIVSLCLSSSLVILLAFSLINFRNLGFWPMFLGLISNFLVILLNGGWMPISPETVQKILPNVAAGAWSIGSRLGTGKDIVLTLDSTKLWFLSDRFTLPAWMHYGIAFSVGDVLMSLGAIWLLWNMGKKKPDALKEFSHE